MQKIRLKQQQQNKNTGKTKQQQDFIISCQERMILSIYVSFSFHLYHGGSFNEKCILL